MGALLESLGIELPVVAAQAVSFVVLLFVLWKFLFAPLENIMRQRTAKIEGDLRDADKARTAADAAQQSVAERLATIEGEVRALREQGKQDGEAERKRLIEQGQEELRERQARAEAQMAQRQEALRRELRAEVADLVERAARRALHGHLGPEMHAAVIEEAIREVERSAEAGTRSR